MPADGNSERCPDGLLEACDVGRGQLGRAIGVAADSAADGAEETSMMIKSAGHAGAAATADVTDPAALQAVVADIVAAHGRLDILHANAGVLMAGTALTQSLEEWDKTYQVNVRGTLLTVRGALPQMVGQGGGAIVISASILASNWARYITGQSLVIDGGLTTQ